jgi:transcriptional regulator with XRE-family HTH domain
MKETTGEKLQRLRKAAGLSQSQLARLARVPVSALRNWEQDRRLPLLNSATRIASSLDVGLEQLIAPDDKSPPMKRRPRTKRK